MSQPTIRPATPADAPAVGQLVRRLLELVVPPERLTPLPPLVEAAARLLDEGKMEAWLAEAGGQAVGLITVVTVHAIYARGAFGEVNELYVEPGFQGSGLSRRLVEVARDHGKAAGWSRLQLSAPQAGTPGAARANAFYARLGFTDVGPTLMLPIA